MINDTCPRNIPHIFLLTFGYSKSFLGTLSKAQIDTLFDRAYTLVISRMLSELSPAVVKKLRDLTEKDSYESIYKTIPNLMLYVHTYGREYFSSKNN